jgi:RNA polymerase sigma factor (sigma-70 family)
MGEMSGKPVGCLATFHSQTAPVTRHVWRKILEESLMDSVTMWISRLKDSHREQAAERLWNRYLERLLQVARHKLGPGPKTTADEEDVAVTAFAEMLSGVRDDRFSQLNDRNDLWQVLIMLTERKAISQRRAEWAQKRGGSEPKQELPIDLEGPEPSPELAAELAEQFQQRLEELPDELERAVAIKRMQGFSNAEIAEALDVGVRTVERKLSLIRRTWRDHQAPGDQER